MKLRSEKFTEKMNKKFLLAIFVAALATTSVQAACANRTEEASGITDDIKCGLSSAGDSLSRGYDSLHETIKEGASNVASSDTFSSISGWFSRGVDSVKSAASKTGDALSKGYNIAVDKTIDSYQVVKDKINGKPAAEFRDGEGVIDFRSGDASTLATLT